MTCPKADELAENLGLAEERRPCGCKRNRCITFEEYMNKHFSNCKPSNKKGEQHGNNL